MTLARMIREDEAMFICDMAETYHIYDYKALPVPYLAVLASGLRDDSRIRMKMSGIRPLARDVALASMADNLSLIRLALTTRKKKVDKPYLFTENLLEADESKRSRGFESGEAFLTAWNQGVEEYKRSHNG